MLFISKETKALGKDMVENFNDWIQYNYTFAKNQRLGS